MLTEGEIPDIQSEKGRCRKEGCQCLYLVSRVYDDDPCELCDHQEEDHLPPGATRNHVIACDSYRISIPKLFGRFEGHTRGHEDAWDGKLLLFPDPIFDSNRKGFSHLISPARNK